MPAADRVGVGRAVEQLDRELPDRVEHPEAPAAPAPHEALHDQGLQAVELRIADRLGRLEREASLEDREAAEGSCSSGPEQLVAPLERRAQRALALGSVARAGGRAAAAAARAGRVARRARAGPRGRRRARLPAGARRGGGRSRRHVPRRGIRGRRPVRARGRASPPRRPRAARRGSDARRRSAAAPGWSRAPSGSASRRAGSRPPPPPRAAARSCRGRSAVACFRCGRPAPHRRPTDVAIAGSTSAGSRERLEQNPEDAVGESLDRLGGELEREARLAAPARPRERHEAFRVERARPPPRARARGRRAGLPGWGDSCGRAS